MTTHGRGGASSIHMDGEAATHELHDEAQRRLAKAAFLTAADLLTLTDAAG